MSVSGDSQLSFDYFVRRGTPVVAIASALGGPVSVIRISGRDLSFLSSAFEKIPEPSQFRYVHWTSKNGEVLDAGLLLNFKAPNSFTGENVLEFQGHGLASVAQSIVEDAISRGCRLALPGEFSFRAVANDKMSLSQAEGLQIALKTEGLQASWAKDLLADSKDKNEVLEKLIAKCFVALSAARGRVEAAVDFPEAEEEQSADVAAALSYLKECENIFAQLLTGFDNFLAYASLPRLAIVGEPNAGKSTLLNLLIGGNKALVSNVAGTTRDVVEADWRLSNGQKLRLLDTAGIREETESQVEEMGIELGLEMAKKALICIWVRNSKTENPNAVKKIRDLLEFRKLPWIEIYSHSEIFEESPRFRANFKAQNDQIRRVLEAKIIKILMDRPQDQERLVISERQLSLVNSAAKDLEECRSALLGEAPIEIAGDLLRSAEKNLRACLGQGLSDDYIGQIFSQFCLGK